MRSDGAGARGMLGVGLGRDIAGSPRPQSEQEADVEFQEAGSRGPSAGSPKVFLSLWKISFSQQDCVFQDYKVNSSCI